MPEFLSPLLLAALSILLGFVGLVWSADRFVAGAASIAESFGIAPVIVGLTIVSFGTSAPEVVVSLIASMKGTGDLAVGNAIGSNIANVGLVLGITLLISRIPVQGTILRHEGAILLGTSILSGIFLFDGVLQRYEGAVLLGLLLPAIWWLTITQREDHSEEELIDDLHQHYSRGPAITWFLIGLGVLIASSKVLVWGAETVALHFGVSPLVIGLTVIAIGTSLPELAASVMSALRGHHDIAVGNIIGSNMFNLLAVMSLPGIFGMEPVGQEVFQRDYIAMMILTLILLGAIAFRAYRMGAKAYLGKVSGCAMLATYGAYLYVLSQSQTL